MFVVDDRENSNKLNELQHGQITSKDETKYSINIDANIDEEKMKKKIETLYLVRDLQNLPANHLNPETYEEKIKEIFKNNKNVKIKVIK